VLTHNLDDLEVFNKRQDKTLIERLNSLISRDFKILTYTDAITLLQNSGKKFEFPHNWGDDLASEHETWIVDHFGLPCVLTN